jgi:hypothetical protein
MCYAFGAVAVAVASRHKAVGQDSEKDTPE